MRGRHIRASTTVSSIAVKVTSRAGFVIRSVVSRLRAAAGWSLVQVVVTLRRPGRLLVLAWLVGILSLGAARAALGDGLFAHPAYTDPRQTLFEAHNPFAYSLTVQPDEDANSGLGLTAALYQIVGLINTLLMWIGLVPLYGALTLLEWFLNLTVYRDSATQIDAAVQSMAGQVFWPLITATVAVGALVSYGKWQADGRSPFGDIAWVLAATTLAITFINRPSDVMSEIDTVRRQLASAVVMGAADPGSPGGVSVTGYPSPTLSGPNTQVAARNLINGLWDSFAATPWCLAEFHELDICKQVGFHALAGDDQWQSFSAVMADNGQVTAFGTWQNWVRGMDLGRLGYVLVLVMMDLPAAIMLLVLDFAGLSAVIGLLGALLLAVLTLVAWPIPGWFRKFGTGWWAWVLGFELVALFITAILAAVMVVSHILGGLAGQYGFFIVGLMNLALMFWAIKARGWVESMTGVGGGGGGAGMTGYLALWGAGRAGAMLKGAVSRTFRGAGGAAGWGARAIANSPRVLSWFRSAPTTAATPHRRVTATPDLDSGPRQLTSGSTGIGSGGGGGGPSGGGGSGKRWRGPRRPSVPWPGGSGHRQPWSSRRSSGFHPAGSDPTGSNSIVVDAADTAPTRPARSTAAGSATVRPTPQPTSPHSGPRHSGLPKPSRHPRAPKAGGRVPPLDGGPRTVFDG